MAESGRERGERISPHSMSTLNCEFLLALSSSGELLRRVSTCFWKSFPGCCAFVLTVLIR